MDTIDRQLLQLLQQNCKLSYAELGSQVGLSTSAVNERLKKLQDGDFIQGYVALVNPHTIQLDVCAFMQVLTSNSKSERAFIERVQKIPEIQECHHITGEFSYLLKIRTSSMARFEALLQDLKPLSGVDRTVTSIVLSTPKETTVLPIYGNG